MVTLQFVVCLLAVGHFVAGINQGAGTGWHVCGPVG